LPDRAMPFLFAQTQKSRPAAGAARRASLCIKIQY
jgi:hypothetical protein